MNLYGSVWQVVQTGPASPSCAHEVAAAFRWGKTRQDPWIIHPTENTLKMESHHVLNTKSS